VATVGSKIWWRVELRRRGRVPDRALAGAVRRGIHRFLVDADGPVLAYRSLPDEIDLDPLIDEAPGRFALTRTPEEGLLTLHRADAPTERHRLGFVQPRADAPVLADQLIRVVLVPGLGFDRSGHRLGRGLGHYDRLLARLAPGSTLVGVTSATTVVDALPVEPHDIGMTHLATEAGVVAVRS
jgi:5-formyltetrahydrofolate cyclo-ligase